MPTSWNPQNSGRKMGSEMCEWGDTVPLVVTVCAEDSHTGKERLETKRIDRCISDIVRALNAGGVRTRSCCCGHGNEEGSIVLQDGRELVLHTSNPVVTVAPLAARNVDDVVGMKG
jgi:hypothetical protein